MRRLTQTQTPRPLGLELQRLGCVYSVRGRPTENRRGRGTASERPGEGACAAEEPLPLEGCLTGQGPPPPPLPRCLQRRRGSCRSAGQSRCRTSRSSAPRPRPRERRGAWAPRSAAAMTPLRGPRRHRSRCCCCCYGMLRAGWRSTLSPIQSGSAGTAPPEVTAGHGVGVGIRTEAGPRIGAAPSSLLPLLPG